MLDDNIIDYAQAISTWTRGFTGRQWLRQSVDEFLASPDQRCLLLSGEPGIGKTAFLAQLSKERPDYLRHFVSAQESDWNLPAAFVQSVGAQLGMKFGLDLLADDESTTQIHTQQIVGQAGTGATVVGVLIQQYTALPVEDMARRLILRPAERLAQRHQGPVVLVVDGLEESVVYSGRPTIADLIVRLASAPNLRIVASSNPGLTLQQLDLELSGAGLRDLVLDEASADNLADLGAYLRSTLDEPEVRQAVETAGLKADAVISALMERSDGNFLYLSTLINAIRSNPAQLDLQSLPASLVAFYQRELAKRKAEAARIGPGAWRREYRPVLGALSVLRASLSLDALAGLAGVERDVAAEVLDSFALWVERRVVDGQPVYRWYHRAVSNFLQSQSDNPDDWFDPLIHHRQIADRLAERFPAPAAITDDYALKHLAAHTRLAGPDTWLRLFALIDPVVRRGWRLTSRSDQAFLGALDEAIQAVLTLSPERALPQLVHYGLVGATLQSMVASVPPELLRELARQGQWQRAVALAQLATGHKGSGLQAAVAGLLDQGSDDNLVIARQVAALIPLDPAEANLHALALAQIATRLAVSAPDQATLLFEEAGRAAATSAELDTQARSLARLGRLRFPSHPSQAAAFFEQALAAVRSMTVELDEDIFAGASTANMVAQTAVEARYVAERTPYDPIGAKARALADVAAEMAAVDDPRATEVFAEAEELVTGMGAGGGPGAALAQGTITGIAFPVDAGTASVTELFREHTLDYLASRRQGPPAEAAPTPIEPADLEARLQATEEVPADSLGFRARALLALAAGLHAGGDLARARSVLDRAESAVAEAAGGFQAELLVKIAALRRTLGEEDTAELLERKAMALAEDEADFSTQYRAWLATRGREAVVSLAEVAVTRSGIQKRRYYSDRALGEMVQSLAAEDPQQAEMLASHIRDPQQSTRAHAAVAGRLASSDGAWADSLVQSILETAAQLPASQADLVRSGAVEVLAPLDPSRAQRLAEAINDSAGRALALTLVAAEPGAAGSLAASLWEAAWQATQQSGAPSASLSQTLARLGDRWMSTGDPRSFEAWEQAERAAIGEPSPSERVEALTLLAGAMRRWQPDRAQAHLAQAEQAARQEQTARGRGKSLGSIAAVWMHLDPVRACQILAGLRQLGRTNFLDGVAQIAPVTSERWGATGVWQLVEGLDRAEAFFQG